MGGPVDIFGGWTFEETLPDLFSYAGQAYNAFGPLAWLVGGILIGSLAINVIIGFVRAAVGQADDD